MPCFRTFLCTYQDSFILSSWDVFAILSVVQHSFVVSCIHAYVRLISVLNVKGILSLISFFRV